MSTSYHAAAFLLAVLVTPGAAQKPVPASLAELKPHEAVEAVISEGNTLSITADQSRRLDSLHIAVRDERHQWERQPNAKAHQRLRMKPMISLQDAYADAMRILAPPQRVSVERRFARADYVPTVPSLATRVPPSLEGLEPHRIVEAIAAEREALRLTPVQVQDLQQLRVAVRDEPHRYRAAAHGPRGKQRLMMEPMISKRRAYNDALSYLSEEQQVAAGRLFRGEQYRPSVGESVEQ